MFRLCLKIYFYCKAIPDLFDEIALTSLAPLEKVVKFVLSVAESEGCSVFFVPILEVRCI